MAQLMDGVIYYGAQFMRQHSHTPVLETSYYNIAQWMGPYCSMEFAVSVPSLGLLHVIYFYECESAWRPYLSPWHTAWSEGLWRCPQIDPIKPDYRDVTQSFNKI